MATAAPPKRGRGRPRKETTADEVYEALKPSESHPGASEGHPEMDDFFDATAPIIGLEDDDLPLPSKTLTDNLKDRIKGFFNREHEDEEQATAEAPRKRGRPSKSNPGQEFINTMLPILAMLITLLFSAPYPAEYKACGPTKPEAESIAMPPLRILARHMKFSAMNPDVWDAIQFMTAIVLYGERALRTAAFISETQRERQGLNGNISGDRERQNGPYQGAYASDLGYGAQPPIGAYPPPRPHDDGGFNPQAEQQPPSDETDGNAAIRGLLEQDTLGRRRLGLGG